MINFIKQFARAIAIFAAIGCAHADVLDQGKNPFPDALIFMPQAQPWVVCAGPCFEDSTFIGSMVDKYVIVN